MICQIGASWDDFLSSSRSRPSVDTLAKEHQISRDTAAHVLYIVNLQQQGHSSTRRVPSVHCKRLIKKAKSGKNTGMTNYEPEHLRYAIECARTQNGIGCRTAARAAEYHFGLPRNSIPHATVHRHLKAPRQRPQGGQRKLGFVEERFVVEHLLMQAPRLTKHELNSELIKIVTRRGRPNPFKNGVPSAGFWRGLTSRHPQLKTIISSSRVETGTKDEKKALDALC